MNPILANHHDSFLNSKNQNPSIQLKVSKNKVESEIYDDISSHSYSSSINDQTELEQLRLKV
jgi:hypothetical protein